MDPGTSSLFFFSLRVHVDLIFLGGVALELQRRVLALLTLGRPPDPVFEFITSSTMELLRSNSVS